LIRQRGRLDPNECKEGPGTLIEFGEEVPDDAPVCRRCGSRHIVVVKEKIVESPTDEPVEDRT
jgi:hypothetical protein